MPPMNQALGLQAFADANFREQIRGALLQDAGPRAFLDVGAALVLHHDGIDAAQIEHMGEHQARGSGSDDPDLRSHGRLLSCQ